MAVFHQTKPNFHDVLSEFKPSQELDALKPDCCTTEQYYLWAASYARSKEMRFGLKLMCRDCTPQFKKKAGSRCSHPDTIFVWRRVSRTGPRTDHLYELVGVKPGEAHDHDRSVREDDPAILYGYKKFDY